MPALGILFNQQGLKFFKKKTLISDHFIFTQVVLTDVKIRSVTVSFLGFHWHG